MPIVTSIYAGFLGLMLIYLAGRVIAVRRAKRIGLGTGGEEALERRIRSHGNFVENVPLFVVLLALLELSGAPLEAIHGLGAGMVISRILHARGLEKAWMPGRFYGTIGSFLMTLLVSGWLVLIGIMTVFGNPA